MWINNLWLCFFLIIKKNKIVERCIIDKDKNNIRCFFKIDKDKFIDIEKEYYNSIEFEICKNQFNIINNKVKIK